jgi:hypothetical protein
MDLFLAKEDKNLFLTNQSDTIYWMFNNKADNQIIDFKVEDSPDTIIGYNCKILTIKTKPIDKETPVWIRRFYYSSKIYVNPEYFKNYRHNNQDFIYSKIQSIPLRIDIEYSDHIVTWMAKSIERSDLNDDLFELNKETRYLQIK